MSKAAELAALISSQTALSDRNLVINGAMNVAQRGTSVASLSSTATYSTCDRFMVQYGSSGTFTESQSTTAPSGFSNSLKLDCTTADSSPNYLLISQRIEGQNVQHLNKGTSSAVSPTLSFYVRSSKTGTYQVNLRDIDNTRIIGATYTISSADTWEQKIITFAGDTTGAFDNDNAASLDIEWWLASGSTYNSGAVPTAWEAAANGDRAAGLNVAIGASTSDDFHITGVQLELGEQATPFEHRSFADDLALCQRYYQRITADASYTAFAAGLCTTTTQMICALKYTTTMRASPTLTQSNTGINIQTQIATASIGTSYLGKDSAFVPVNVSSGLTAGNAGLWNANNNTAAYVDLTAEL